MALQGRLEGGPADRRSLVVPTLAEAFYRYEPCTRPPIDLSDLPVKGEVTYRYDCRWRQGQVMVTGTFAEPLRRSLAQSGTPSDRTRGEQDRQPVRVMHRRYGDWSVWSGLIDTARRPTEAERGEAAEHGLDVDEERQQEEPGPRRRGRWSRRDVTVEHVEFQDPGVVVRNLRIAEEDRAQPAAGGVEETRPVTLDLSVLQQVKAEPVPVEAQAGVEVADDQHSVMNGGTHSASSLAVAADGTVQRRRVGWNLPRARRDGAHRSAATISGASSYSIRRVDEEAPGGEVPGAPSRIPGELPGKDAWLRWRGGAGGGRARPAASRRCHPCALAAIAAAPVAWRG
jgi:hypothetical protein